MILMIILAEFEPNQSSGDDEETIEAEEKGSGADAIDHNKEIEMLKRESELPLEDLLKQLPEEYLNNVEPIVKTNDKVFVFCFSLFFFSSKLLCTNVLPELSRY